MSIETELQNVVAAASALNQTVRGQIDQINATVNTTATNLTNNVNAKLSQMDAWRDGHLDEHPAFSVNANADFLTLSGEAPVQLPSGMGVHANGDFWNKFEVEIIPVRSGPLPEERPPLVRELLQFMNMDRQHFSAAFNIMRMSIKAVTDFGPYVFHIPAQHVKAGPFTSVILYHKIVGRSSWGWMNNGIKDAWAQATHHVYSGNDAGGYVHVDVGIGGPSDVGDTLYLALPQIVPGKWNPNHRAPQFYTWTNL